MFWHPIYLSQLSLLGKSSSLYTHHSFLLHPSRLLSQINLFNVQLLAVFSSEPRWYLIHLGSENSNGLVSCSRLRLSLVFIIQLAIILGLFNQTNLRAVLAIPFLALLFGPSILCLVGYLLIVSLLGFIFFSSVSSSIKLALIFTEVL